MRYSVSVTKRQKEHIPLLLRALGISHPQDDIRRPGGFPLWQIIYGVSGSGEFFLDGERAVLSPGQIAILEPGVRHGYRSLGGDWTVHYVGFEGEICTRLLTFLNLVRPGIYSLADPTLFLSHLEKLAALAVSESSRQSACSKELYSLLLDLSTGVRRLPMSQAAEGSGLVREMILFLEDHYSEDLSLDSLSQRFGMTPEYLCFCFKDAAGETIMQYLRRIRIHHAKIMLMESPDAGLKEIAGKCGFSSVSYFGRVFRESTGFTPQGYRLGVRKGQKES